MEISAMIVELKNKIATTETEAARLEQVANELRTKLAAIEPTLKQHRDDLTAMRMSVESLELVGGHAEKKVAPPIPQVAISVTATKEPPRPAPKENPRKAKKVAQIAPSGKEIRVFASVNQCASQLGWTYNGVKKYIETVSPEKQMRMKGFVLKYKA